MRIIDFDSELFFDVLNRATFVLIQFNFIRSIINKDNFSSWCYGISIFLILILMYIKGKAEEKMLYKVFCKTIGEDRARFQILCEKLKVDIFKNE
jgi:hypothetical protein